MGFQAVKCQYIEGSKNGPVKGLFGHGPIKCPLWGRTCPSTFTCVKVLSVEKTFDILLHKKSAN